MRIASLVFAGALATGSLLAGPSLARNVDVQKGEDKSVGGSASCSAYQQAADGSWEQLPCKETGERNQQPAHQRSRVQSEDQTDR